MATTPQVLLDRYEVGRLLGAGGLAEVFEGRDRLLARRVAIKVLQAQFARDPSFVTRFKREAQIGASLRHPNIVEVYDNGTEDGTHFIVMEYVEGRTLKDVIRTEGPMSPERAAEITADVCSALAATHARGIVHRDINPGNVMLTPEGKVKVMGFGIARATTSETITQTAAVVGTAQYISPEQAQGHTVDGRSDIYSLGCSLYEMLTGTVPFTGDSPVAIAYRHVREDPTPPRMLNTDVPAPLEAICLKAMAKLPDNRYQTAAELHDDLERFRNYQPRIFLCYRREDSQWAARSIYDRLTAKYGSEQVFRDIDSTPAGVKFSTWIESRVGQCDVMIVVIGDAWSSAKDHTGKRRLDAPKDWVRQEIETALRRDIPIIPVRVQGARMPTDDELPPSIAELTGFQSAEVTDSRWDFDVGLLIEAIDNLIRSG
jgi:serine/threonine protein kinase